VEDDVVLVYAVWICGAIPSELGNDLSDMSIMNVARQAPDTTFIRLRTTLAVTIVRSFTLAADSNAQETLQPYAPPTLHTFLDSANVYQESVTVDQSSGTFFVGSVKEGAFYKGKIGRPILEVFSPGGAEGRSIATGMFFANNHPNRRTLGHARSRGSICSFHLSNSLVSRSTTSGCFLLKSAFSC